MMLGNGRWETAQFNTRQQVTQLGLGTSATDTSLWKNEYQYGELNPDGSIDTSKNTGNIARQTLTIPSASFTQSYKYDSLYRLTEAKEVTGTNTNWTQTFGYDIYGNRTSFSQTIGGVQTNGTPVVNPSTNRFTSSNFTYDKNGNVTRDIDPVTNQARQFVFNGENKQTEVRDANGNPIGNYYYDGEGKRVKKVTAAETTIFVYSGGKLVAEYSTQISQDPTISYTTTDHLGSPRIITDKLGNVRSRRDFMPFGEDIFAGIGGRSAGQNYSSTQDDIRQKFTGYQKDSETSLDFAEARMYENRYGRFTAVDPLLVSGKSANPQSFNRYVYVGNSPLRRVDPAGEDWWDVTDRAGTRHILWSDEDPDEELYDINDRWEKYLYQASDSKWYALNPDGPESEGFSEYQRAYWQYGNYVNFDGAYEGFVYDMFSVNDMAHMIAGMKTGNVEDSVYYFGKISIQNGVGSGLGKFVCARSGATSTLGLNTADEVAGKAITSMVPASARSLGRWGEARLAQILGNAGEKPARALVTNSGIKRFVDRLVNGIAHEAKAGLNVKLTPTLEKQILTDAQLIRDGVIDGAHWHFFRGASREILDFLTKHEIIYTVH